MTIKIQVKNIFFQIETSPIIGESAKILPAHGADGIIQQGSDRATTTKPTLSRTEQDL